MPRRRRFRPVMKKWPELTSVPSMKPLRVSDGMKPFFRCLIFLSFLRLGFLSAHSLLPNGDFSQPDPTHPERPAHWEAMDGVGVQWTELPVVPGSSIRGKGIRMNTALTEVAMDANWTKAGLTQFFIPHPDSSPIAETYGLSLYSEGIPLDPTKAYRISFDYLAEKGTAGKVWFRCYQQLPTRLMRKYEGVLDCGSHGQWRHCSEVYHPFVHAPTVTVGKIMLFSFYPAGVCWFANVSVEPVPETSPARAPLESP